MLHFSFVHACIPFILQSASLTSLSFPSRDAQSPFLPSMRADISSTDPYLRRDTLCLPRCWIPSPPRTMAQVSSLPLLWAHTSSASIAQHSPLLCCPPGASSAALGVDHMLILPLESPVPPGVHHFPFWVLPSRPLPMPAQVPHGARQG